MNTTEVIQILNQIFKHVNNKWEARISKERDIANGSDDVMVYIKYNDTEYSDFMTRDQAIKYIGYIKSVGLANFQKPVFEQPKAATATPTPTVKKEYPPYLRLVVDNTRKDYGLQSS